MRGRIRSISGHLRQTLDSGWQIACAPAGTLLSEVAAKQSLPWRSAGRAGTVAEALRSRKEWSLDAPARRFDAEDWWYLLHFDAPLRDPEAKLVLGLDGLATIADVWLNDDPLLHSENMFVAHEIELASIRERGNELLIRFSSLDKALEARRPRPRWRTPMVENQQLRWLRTSLLGRTPGWSPAAAAVGPWRPVWLEARTGIDVSQLSVEPTVQKDLGIVEVKCTIQPIGGAEITNVLGVVSHAGSEWSMRLSRRAGSTFYSGRLDIPNIQRWWPHTHGEPALYQVRLHVTTDGGHAPAIEVDAGDIGFRTVSIGQADDDFQVLINEVPIFCRGACWTPLDCVSLHGDGPEVDEAIAQARRAGMNMLRVGGTMCYESDRFLDACDAQGMLLWQDFMFANMDYPAEDPAFRTSVETEARQFLHRLSGRPCATVLCGNSEGEQQAAMFGAPRERWSHPLFEHGLAQLAAEGAPGVPYWPSSAHGGAFPHQGNAGTTSYYGVGAYRLPPQDARRSDVRFATECLAFANIPEEDAIAAMPGGLGIKVHHPAWKARSPRDLGAGWDFDDIRDHYLATLFGVDPLELRYADHDRYLDLGRIASAEAMAAAFREWRRARSSCRGALVWFLRDLWPGAGWGVIDSLGAPKAAYYFLSRVLQPRAIVLTDEGGNGLFAHLINDSAVAFDATLEVTLYRNGETIVGSGRKAVRMKPHQTFALPLAELFDGFLDLTHAYRFGPQVCDAVLATLKDADGTTIARDFYFPRGLRVHVESDIGLSATIRPTQGAVTELTVTARRLAQYVVVRGPGLACEDQYFHLAPGIAHTVRIRASRPEIKGQVRALNSAAGCRITVQE
jgi:beta-mannosidase